jgi:hypothetical protein
MTEREAYANELFIETGIEAPEDIKTSVGFRIERQAIMRRPNRPQCTFYVHEPALQVRLGDARPMEDQYLRLLFNTHVLRVVPATATKAALLSNAACTSSRSQSRWLSAQTPWPGQSSQLTKAPSSIDPPAFL